MTHDFCQRQEDAACFTVCVRVNKMKKTCIKDELSKTIHGLHVLSSGKKQKTKQTNETQTSAVKIEFFKWLLWFKRAPNVSACVRFLQYNIPAWLESSVTSTRAETPAGIIRALLSHPTRDAVLRLIMQQHFKEGKCWLFDERVCPWDVFGHQFQRSNSPSVPVFRSEGWRDSQINHFRGRPTRVNSACGWRHYYSNQLGDCPCLQIVCWDFHRKHSKGYTYLV